MSPSLFSIAITSLLSAALAAFALWPLARSGRWRVDICLTLFLGSAVACVAFAVRPDLWTYEANYAYECWQVLLVVGVGLERSRRWLCDRPVSLRILHVESAILLVLVIAFGAFGQIVGPWGDSWGYRGLVPVDVAAALVLLSVLGCAEGHTDDKVLYWLAVTWAIHGLSLACWEINTVLGYATAWASFLVYLWALYWIRLSFSDAPQTQPS